MNKKGNLFMVGVLLANIFIQPLFSLQPVFAEGEEVAIESHQEVYEDVELVTEESGDLNIVPPSEQENLVEEVVTEEEINSEYDEISDDDNSNLEENLEFDETEVESVEENASSNAVISFIQQTYESEAVGYTSSLKFNVANIGNAAAENVVVRVQLPVNYIEEYSNMSDYFYNQGLTNLSQHYEGNNLYVNCNIGDLPTGYNKDFSFGFKTITEIQEENIIVPVTVQVLENGNTVDQIGPVVYNFVNPNITYPEEDDDDDSDSMKVMAIRAASDAFYALEPEYNEETGEFALRFQYDLTKLSGGEEFTVEIDPNFVELNELQDNVNYTVIKDGSTYKIKFKDEFSGANQGIISIKTKTKKVDKSGEYEIKWKLDDENFSETIFIKKPGDSESDIKEEKSSKNVQSYIWDLGNKIKGEVNGDGEQSITVEDDITSVKIPYTLVYETTTGGNLNIKDELDNLLTYNKGSFTAKLESWDSNGWNKETTDNVDLSDYLTFDGNTFSIEGYELPPNSRITINYNANVKDAKALETHLNQLLENEELDGKEGSVSYVFNNKAKINDDDRDGNYSGNVNVPGEKPEVKPEYPSNVLEKYVDPTTANATFDNEGKLIPIPVTYTLKLNMSKFNGDNIKQLTENLILTDNLDPNHKVEFELSDVTIISDGGVTVQEGTVDNTDETIGNYSIENKQFKFNAGKEPADYTIILKGNITALNNQKDSWSPIPAFDYYSYKNTAVAEAGDFKDTGEATTTVIDRKGQTSTNDRNVFNKTQTTNPSTPVLGEPFKVTYTFVVNDWNAGVNAVDISKSTITDVLDPIFDLDEGYDISLSDNWNGQSTDYITTNLNDGVLTLDFDDAMPEEIKKARWVINVTLTTKTITDQSQALIRNNASLTGTDTGIDYTSSTQTSGETTGGELYVRKTVTDLDKVDYVKNYTLELDAEGKPKHTEFNYKIDLIPQTDFYNTTIIPLEDIIPDQLDFIGLLSSGDADSATPTNGTQGAYTNSGGQVDVVFEEGVLKIANNGTRFGKGPISLRFRVKLKEGIDLKAGDTISNVITKTDPPANITVVDPGTYPLNISKVDSVTGERVLDEKQVARFKLEKVEEDGTKTTVYNDIRIDSGQLVDAEGKALVVESIGNYLLTETKAPTGYILSEEPISIRVTENGTIPGQIVVQNTPGEDQPETTTHTVVKEWEVEEGVATPAVKVTLYNGENIANVEDATVELNSTNGYTYTWENLPADGVYTVVETESEEYEQVSNTTSEDGLTTITNKLVETDPETTTHTVVKEWEVEEGVATPAVKVTLYNGENIANVEDATVELNSTNGYTYTWENLPADGVYTVVETESEEYEQVSNTTSEDGLTTITNKLVETDPETTTHTVVKEWEVEEGVATPAVKVTLYNGEVAVENSTTELNAENGYTHTWNNLPADGDYHAIETPVDGYKQVSSITAEGTTTIVNAPEVVEPELVSHTVVKKWDVEEGTVTPAVSVTLYNGEVAVENSTTELNAENGYTHTWTNLPADGDYHAIETPVDGYKQVSSTTAEGTTTIVNAPEVVEPELVSHTVVKKWDVEEGTVTPAVSVTLYNGEVAVENSTTELNAENGYTHTWTNLPADGDYHAIETPVDGYEQVSSTTAEGTTTIVNAPEVVEPELVSHTVVKKWDVEEGTVTPAVSVTLYNGDVAVENSTTELNAENGYTHTWTNLPADGDYHAIETPVDGYEQVSSTTAEGTTTIVNAPEVVEPELVSHTVVKKWDVAEGTVTPAVSVTLYNGDVAVENSTTELNAGNGYTHTWTDLPADGDYKAIETPVDGYEQVSSTTAEGTTTIVNAPEVVEPEKTYAVGDYTWIDANKDGIQDADEDVLAGVIVELFDGEGNKLGTTTTNEHGFYMFDELPAGNYQVKFTLTDEQAAIYTFTKADAGDDAQDSDANPETGFTIVFTLDDDNKALTKDYDGVKATEGIDPTWDAGVIVKEVEPEEPGEPEEPTEPEEPGDKALPNTGEVSWVWLSIIVLVLGISLLILDRRKVER